MPLLEQVTITDVAAEGKAIAKVNDMVIFVPFVAPGDVVDIKITKKKKNLLRRSKGKGRWRCTRLTQTSFSRT